MADITPHHIVQLATTNILVFRYDSVREASTTGIALIERCNELFVAIV